MKLTFLGTGTSQGVPTIANDFTELDLANRKNWRTRSSAYIDMGGLKILVDAAPELRMQCLDNDIRSLDIFLLTHGHADHIAGMDDLRRFCDMREDNTLPVYSNAYGTERIRAMFPYALGDKPKERGYPCFRLKEMPNILELSNGGRIYSTPLKHGPVETLGLVFEFGKKRIAYFTDCKKLSKEAKALAKNADVVVLDALKLKEHPSHMSIYEAIEAAQNLHAKQTFFTHMTGHIDYGVWSQKLPPNMYLAYDTLCVEI